MGLQSYEPSDLTHMWFEILSIGQIFKKLLIWNVIFILSKWYSVQVCSRPEQIMKEEKRGQGGAQAADFCPSDWAGTGGEVGACVLS